MPSYLVTYDLNVPGQDYKDLIEALEGRFQATRILKSAWLVNTSGTANDLAYELYKHMDASDGLFVAACRPGCRAVKTLTPEDQLERKLRS